MNRAQRTHSQEDFVLLCARHDQFWAQLHNAHAWVGGYMKHNGSTSVLAKYPPFAQQHLPTWSSNAFFRLLQILCRNFDSLIRAHTAVIFAQKQNEWNEDRTRGTSTDVFIYFCVSVLFDWRTGDKADSQQYGNYLKYRFRKVWYIFGTNMFSRPWFSEFVCSVDPARYGFVTLYLARSPAYAVSKTSQKHDRSRKLGRIASTTAKIFRRKCCLLRFWNTCQLLRTWEKKFLIFKILRKTDLKKRWSKTVLTSGKYHSVWFLRWHMFCFQPVPMEGWRFIHAIGILHKRSRCISFGSWI